MHRSALLALLLLATGRPVLAQTPDFVLVDGAWFQRDHGDRLMRVDPHVISLRFGPAAPDWLALVAALEARSSVLADEVARMQLLRTNRLGIADLRLGEGQDPLAITRALAATGLCRFVEPNTIGEWHATPSDPSFGVQWALENTGQNGGLPGADIGMVGAWDLETGDPNVLIAVLDGGCDVFHPDLVANRYENAGDPINGLDDDGNGFVDDYYGWDFEFDDNDVTSNIGHGTQVAGILGARTDNGLGIAGVAGGFGADDGCTFLPCGIGSSQGPIAAVIDDAIVYAADQGARVLTMSFSVMSNSSINAAIDYAVNEKGVFLCASAGNNGGPNSIAYPARHDDVVAVGATTNQDQVAAISNRGPQLWITAPGELIYSTSLINGYINGTGTSFSSPQVAGVVGLMISANPALTPAHIARILADTAFDIDVAGFDVRTGHGRLDAEAAIAYAAGCGLARVCTSTPNSTGQPARMQWTGSTSVDLNDLTLVAEDCPSGQNGLFFYGPGEQQVPFGNGFLCVTGPHQRLGIVNSGAAGVATQVLDVTAPPQPSGQILAGSSWTFQFWYRDPAAGGAAFDTSDALTVHFCL